MKLVLPLIGLLMLLMPHQGLTAQDTTEIALIEYYPGFVFKDGLYLSIDDVRANDPLPFARIVSNSYEYDRDFINKLIIKEDIILYDDAGVRASIKSKDVWGYALHGRLHILVGGKFQRIHLMGNISHFVASATTIEKKYFSEEDSSSGFTTTSDLYRNFYREKYYYETLTSEGDMCLYDFETNTLAKYDPAALGKLLERDSLLFSEYNLLRRKEKKNRMGEFIRRYNLSKPLYFPAQ